MNNSMKVTIKDIAKMAGVSHPTVSKALNDVPGVAEETRNKILSIAKQMNYMPNMAAKRLSDKKSNCIGLIWPVAESLFFYNLCMLIHAEAGKRGINVITSLVAPAEAMRTFNQHFVDHIIYWCYPRWVPTIEFLKEKEQFHGELLLVGGGKMDGAHCISIDRITGIYKAVDHFVRLGHRRISFLGESSDKLTGFTQAFVEYGLEYHPDYVVRTDDRNLDFDQKIRDLLVNNNNKPTGILVDSQAVLFRLVRLLRILKVSVPDDISVIVYDDIPEMERFEIPFTTVGPSIEKLAKASIESLMRGPETNGSWVHAEIKSELTIRHSTKQNTAIDSTTSK